MTVLQIRQLVQVVISLVGGFLLSTPCWAVEPEATFVAKGKWVALILTRDNQPVADAQVRVFTASGNQYAEGETGPQGRGEFPMPPGSMFMVEIRSGGRTADQIR